MASAARATMFCAAATSSMSVMRTWACRPLARTSAATASSSSRVRAASATSAPWRANASAIARPMPRPAPVTSAFLPSYENMRPPSEIREG